MEKEFVNKFAYRLFEAHIFKRKRFLILCANDIMRV
jgi:hypothetical protein